MKKKFKVIEGGAYKIEQQILKNYDKYMDEAVRLYKRKWRMRVIISLLAAAILLVFFVIFIGWE